MKYWKSTTTTKLAVGDSVQNQNRIGTHAFCLLQHSPLPIHHVHRRCEKSLIRRGSKPQPFEFVPTSHKWLHYHSTRTPRPTVNVWNVLVVQTLVSSLSFEAVTSLVTKGFHFPPKPEKQEPRRLFSTSLTKEVVRSKHSRMPAEGGVEKKNCTNSALAMVQTLFNAPFQRSHHGPMWNCRSLFSSFLWHFKKKTLKLPELVFRSRTMSQSLCLGNRISLPGKAMVSTLPLDQNSKAKVNIGPEKGDRRVHATLYFLRIVHVQKTFKKYTRTWTNMENLPTTLHSLGRTSTS